MSSVPSPAFRSAGVAALLAALALATGAQAVGSAQQLNGPFPLIPSGGVGENAFTADGARLVYVTTPEGTLWGAAPTGASVRLSPPGVNVALFQIAPVGRRVVFRLFPETADLYSVLADGSAPAVKLNGPLVAHGNVTLFRITPGGSHVVYMADALQDARTLLYGVPIGGGPALVLNAPMGAGQDVLDFEIAPDSTHVAYRVGHVFVATIGVAASGVDVSGVLVSGGAIERGLRFTPDGTRVVYRADQLVNDRVELFSAPSDGSAPAVKLSAQRDVEEDFAVSPAGDRVVYRASQSVLGVIELFSVPVDGSAAPVRLCPILNGGRDVVRAQVSADGTRVVYLADQVDGLFELFSAPIDGSAPAFALNPALAEGEDVLSEYLLTPDARVLFQGATPQGARLLARVIDGSVAALELDQGLDPLGGGLRLLPDGAHVLYRKPVVGGMALWNAPTDGSGAPVIVGGGRTGVRSYGARPDSEVVSFVADRDLRGVNELFAGPSDQVQGVIQVSADTPPDRIFGAVFQSRTAAGGALYVAREEDPNFVDLYAISLTGAERRRINGSAPRVSVLETGPLELAAGGRALFLEGRQVGGAVSAGGLFSTPVGGGAEPIELDGGLALGRGVSDYALAPDRATVFFRADRDADEVLELYRVPVDGSALPVKVSGPLVPGGDVQAGYRPAVGGRVVFLADADTDETYELFGADALGAVVRLSGTLPSTGDVEPGFVLSPDGTRAFYRADANADGVLELFAVPVDGSAAPLALSGTLVSGGDVADDLGVTPTRVLFRGDLLVDERFDLYSVPADGSAPPTWLDLGGVVGGDVQDGFLIDPAGQRAVYRADTLRDGRNDLFSVPVAGGPPARLNRGSGSSGSVEPLESQHLGSATAGFGISPDGTRVVFLGVEQVERELYSVPIDGSGPPLELNGPLSPSNFPGIDAFWFDPLGQYVIYVGDREDPLFNRILVVPIDRSRPPTDLSPTDAYEIVRYDVHVAADGSSVLFRTNFLNNRLFAVQLRRTPLPRSQAPR